MRTDARPNEPVSKGTFGHRLRAYRERAGLTQEELAERAGLSRDAISALERGKRSRPYAPTINALADALGLTADERASLRSSARTPPETEPEAALFRGIPDVLTRLVGRENELTELQSMLRSDSVRLLTITGPGGVGKTRLAIELLQTMRPHLSDHVGFVPLGVILESSFVLPAIAEKFAVRNPGGTALPEQIAGVLSGQPFLLLLDNLEHLPDAGNAVAALLRACPSLQIVVTSRSPLRIRGEHEFPLLTLAVNREAGLTGAVELFVERARSTRPDFALTTQNESTIQAICRRLDGLPLAIELAAARIKVLSPEALLERLMTGIDVLSGGPRDQDARLQSVRSAIAWSYDLLDERDQAVFRALCVFVGAYSLTDAELLLHAALGLNQFDSLDALTSLIDKSLIRNVRPDAADPQYAMLYTIRSFGLAALEASPESWTIHRAHAMQMLAVVEQAADAFRNRAGAEQQPWFARLEQERGNWRAALAWLHEHGEQEALLRMTTGLAWFWYVRGPIKEGRFWLQRAIAMPHDASPPELRPRALVGKGLLDHYSGDLGEARSTLIESLNTAPDPPEQWWTASAELFVGMTATAQGDYPFALEHLERSMAIYRQIPHPINESIALGYLAAATWGAGDADRAAELCREAESRQRALRDTWGLGRTLGYLALIQSERADHPAALLELRANLQIRQESLRIPMAGADHSDAPHWEAGVWDDVAVSLGILGVALVGLDRLDDAVFWFGRVQAVRESIGGLQASLPERAVFERAEEVARVAIGPVAAANRYAAGQEQPLQTSLDEAITLVEQCLEEYRQKTGAGSLLPRSLDRPPGSTSSLRG